MSTRVNNTKVIISARASYLYAFEPDSINGSDPKYSVSLIIDKKDTDLIAKIKKAVEQAKEDGKSKWGNGKSQQILNYHFVMEIWTGRKMKPMQDPILLMQIVNRHHR